MFHMHDVTRDFFSLSRDFEPLLRFLFCDCCAFPKQSNAGGFSFFIAALAIDTMCAGTNPFISVGLISR